MTEPKQPPADRQPDDSLPGGSSIDESLSSKLEGGMAAGFGGTRRSPSSGILDRLAATSGVKSRILLREEPGHPASLLQPGDGSAHSAGKYAVQGEIARGGVGIVLKGHDNDLGRDVALKFLRSKYCDNGSILQRFVEEAQIGGQLQHPGIVPVYDVGIADGKPFFTMKLIKGRTLAALLEEREDPGRGRRRFLDIFEAVCQTMAYAHARGVIHRDLKPANVMVGAFGEVQVVDWGMAKVLPHGGTADEKKLAHAQSSVSIIETVRSTREGTRGTASVVGSVMGTPSYMPPEQARGDVENMDERSDVFALGALLCEILTGQPPYVGEAEDLVAMAANCATEEARQRLNLCGADQVLIELCEQCLCPAPAARPRSAAVLAERVAEHLHSVEERAHQAQIDAAEARVKATAERKARRLTVGLAASVLLTVGLAIGGYYWNEAEARDRRRATEEKIASALVDATVAQSQKDWPVAVAAAQRAEDLLSDDVGQDIHQRVNETSGEIGRAATAAAAQKQLTERNERLLLALADVRQPEGDHIYLVDWTRLVSAYRDTFRADGLDLLSGTEPDAADAVIARRVPVELAAYIDSWAQAASRAKQKESAARLTRIANLADPDETRRELRRAFVSGSTDDLKKFAEREDLRSWPPQTLHLLGGALFRKRAMTTALRVYQIGQRTHPTDFALNLGLGMVLTRYRPRPRFWEASRFFQVAFALRPESVEVQHQLGMALTYQDNDRSRREALQLFRAAVKQRPEDGHLWFHVAACLGFLKEDEQALSSYRESIRLNPNYKVAQLNLAKLLWSRLGRPEEAAVHAAEAVRLQPDDDNAHSILASLWWRLGRHEEAVVHAAEAVRLKPDNDGYHSARVGILERLGRFDEIVSIYSKLAEDDPKRMEYQVQLAQGLYHQGRHDEAIRILRRAVKRGEAPRVWCALAMNLSKAGRPREAVSAARQAITLATEPQPIRTAALTLANLGQHDEALARLRKVLEQMGTKESRGTIRCAIGKVLVSQGKSADAVREYREAIAQDPGVLQACNAQGDFAIALQDVGEFAEAVGFYGAAIQRQGASAELRCNLGSCLHQSGKTEEGRVELRVALRLDSGYAPAYVAIGDVHLDKGEFKDADRAYRKSLQLDSKLASAHYGLGRLFQAQGQWDSALRQFRAAIRLNSKVAPIHTELGIVLLEQGLFKEALPSLREAVRLAPRYANAHAGLGHCLMAMGKIDEAEVHMRRAIMLAPDRGEYINNLGVLMQEKGRQDEAELQFRAAIRLGYRGATVYINLGTALYHQGKLDAAANEFQRVIRNDSKHAGAHAWLGVTLVVGGKTEEAKRAYRQCLRLNSKLITLAKREAWSLARSRKNRAAEAVYRLILEFEPDDGPTHASLGTVLARLGRLKEAIGFLRRAVELDPDRPRSLLPLADVLLRAGHAQEALPLYEKGHAIGSKQPDWPYPSARWIAEARRQAKRELRLLAIVHGKAEPADATEAVQAARLAYKREWYLASVRLTRDAFRQDASLAANLVKYYRYNGACAAALAASGRGEDARNLNKERAALRAQALTWLQEDLAALRLQARYDLSRALKQLRHMQTDPDLVAIRAPEATNLLDRNEQDRCRAFWKEVQNAISKLDARDKSKKHSHKREKTGSGKDAGKTP